MAQIDHSPAIMLDSDAPCEQEQMSNSACGVRSGGWCWALRGGGVCSESMTQPGGDAGMRRQETQGRKLPRRG